MNKSIKIALITGVILIVVLTAISIFFTKKVEPQPKPTDWVKVEKNDGQQKIYIPSQKISFIIPEMWNFYYDKEKKDSIIKTYGEYEKTPYEITEGVGNGCQIWEYQRKNYKNIDELKETLTYELNEDAKEFDNKNISILNTKILNKPSLVTKYDNEAWGNTLSYYILEGEIATVLSLSYNNEDKEKCIKIMDKTIESLIMNE